VRASAIWNLAPPASQVAAVAPKRFVVAQSLLPENYLGALRVCEQAQQCCCRNSARGLIVSVLTRDLTPTAYDQICFYSSLVL
jgi:hypothetical protein